MANYAVVPLSGGTVNNIVVGENIEQVRLIVGDAVEITEETGSAGIGYTWDGVTFSAPLEKLENLLEELENTPEELENTDRV